MTPSQKCKIHTAKKGRCPGKGSCKYRDNCQPQLPWKNWEAHHILSVSCINGYGHYQSEIKEYIRRCYRETEWCINQRPNLVGLPKLSIYQRYPASRGLNLPCHDWDHNSGQGYCFEVKVDLDSIIWSKLDKGKKTHSAKGESILKDIEYLETEWRKELHRRGTRRGGTAKCWDNRKSDKDWFQPFSMGSDDLVEGESGFYGG